jgi:RNA polymerase sigma-70 factor (ECF subfamily)
MVVARKEHLFPVMPDREPGPLSDAELVRRAQADLEAFVDLYNRYVDPIFRYCNRHLPRTAAEDATSITFLNAIRAIRRFDPERSGFRSWLFTIAHNAIVDQLRARRHLPIDEVELTATDAALDEGVIAADRRRQFRVALSRLGADQQQVIHLRLAGLSGPEIAEAMGKSQGAVRTIQHRAVRELRRLMGMPDLAIPDETRTT